MASDIVLTVDDGEPADAARFFSVGTQLVDLLDDLAERSGLKWDVTELRMGSGVSGLTCTGDGRELGVSAAKSAVLGLKLIRGGAPAPPDWTPDVVARAKELARVAGDRTKIESHGNVIWIDQVLRNRLEDISPWVREFYGSVRGQLTGVNVTRGNRASIKPHGGGRVVHVGFTDALAERMARGLLQFVEVDGLVRQNEDGRNYFVRADDIHLPVAKQPTWHDLRGSMPDATDGLSIPDYLEAIRGDE